MQPHEPRIAINSMMPTSSIVYPAPLADWPPATWLVAEGDPPRRRLLDRVRDAIRTKHYSRSTVLQRAVREAALKLGTTKRVTCHTLGLAQK
jgi:hypothetical protein